METNIVIKIECGDQVWGTIGWFKELIDNSEFVIDETEYGTPAIFLVKLDENDEEKSYLLCKKYDKDRDLLKYPNYKLTDDGYLCEKPDRSDADLFNAPLTPACKRAVEEMIMKVKNIFAEWWENDGNIQKILQYRESSISLILYF